MENFGGEPIVFQLLFPYIYVGIKKGKNERGNFMRKKGKTAQKTQDLLTEAIALVKDGKPLSNQMVYELQHMPHDQGANMYRKEGWEFFDTVFRYADWRQYTGVLIPLVMDLMYPLFSIYYTKAANHNRYNMVDDLKQDLSLKMLEEWFPAFDPDASIEKPAFPKFVHERAKRVTLDAIFTDTGYSAYIIKKRQEAGESVGVCSLDAIKDSYNVDENIFDNDQWVLNYDEGYNGEDISHLYFNKEQKNTIGLQLKASGIDVNSPCSKLEDVTKQQAQNFTRINKLCGGPDNPLIAKALNRVTEQKTLENQRG